MTNKKKAPTAKKESPAAEPKKKPTGGSKKKSAATAVQKGASAKTIKRPRSVAEAASNVAADEKGYVFINGRRVRMISTRGMAPVKKSRPVPAETVVDEYTGPSKPLKTRLSKKELTHYRNLLLIKRAEIVGDLDAMEAAALRSSGGNISHMPIHMADIGSDTYEQDFMLGMAESERKQIREIDDALMRISDSTYGVCQLTGEPIPKARLDAKPWAKYTIEAARQMEGHWQSR